MRILSPIRPLWGLWKEQVLEMAHYPAENEDRIISEAAAQAIANASKEIREAEEAKEAENK